MGVGVLDGAGVGVLDGAEVGMSVGVFGTASGVLDARTPPAVGVGVGAKANAFEAAERERDASSTRAAIKKFPELLDIQFVRRI